MADNLDTFSLLGLLHCQKKEMWQPDKVELWVRVVLWYNTHDWLHAPGLVFCIFFFTISIQWAEKNYQKISTFVWFLKCNIPEKK